MQLLREKSMNYIAEIKNNHGSITQYYLNSLKITPAEVEFKATKSYGFIGFIIFVFAILLVVPLAKFIHIFIKDINEDLFLSATIATIATISLLVFTNYIMQRIPIGNVKYKDKKVTIDGITYSFYTDVWDIEYSRNIINSFFSSATLVFYIITAKTKNPISYRIKFDQDAKAKYIYDLFHTKMREE